MSPQYLAHLKTIRSSLTGHIGSLRMQAVTLLNAKSIALAELVILLRRLREIENAIEIETQLPKGEES